MGKKVIIKTHMKNPPKVLEYWWGETPLICPVLADGTLEGLTVDYPRFHTIKHEWKLEVIEVNIEESNKGKKDKKGSLKEVISVGKEV